MTSAAPRLKRAFDRKASPLRSTRGPLAVAVAMLSTIGGACLVTAPSTDELVGSCNDGVKNGEESDIDCGADCSACGTGKRCTSDEACASRLCTEGKCEAGTCDDDALNGDETDEDCGGSCPACGDGSKCSAPEDCLSGSCVAQRCQPATCEDGIKNGLEVDVDCGFDELQCLLCRDGSTCGKDDDCESGKCGPDGLCDASSCTDMIWNGDEGALDCGAQCPIKCASGQSCFVPADCLSGNCVNFICA